MSTFMAKPAEIQRKWYIVDAAGKPLGRTAVKVADLLRGKGKPEFTPHVDCGDHVVVINAEKAVLTGKKLEQKMYRHHTGYIGNMKEENYAKLMSERSDFAITLAVKGMLPKSNMGREMLKRLFVYKDANHGHEAQKPQTLVLKEANR